MQTRLGRHAAGKAMASAWLEAGAATKPQKRHGRVYARPTGAMLARRALSYNREERALLSCPIIGKRGHSDWPLCVLTPLTCDNPLNSLSIVIAA